MPGDTCILMRPGQRDAKPEHCDKINCLRTFRHRMRLPEHIDPEYFDKTYRLQPERWRDAAAAICRTNGLPAAPVRAFADGSNLVAAVAGRYVVKIFPDFHRHQWESEYRVLAQLNRCIRVPVPELIASGEWPEGWTYVVMSCLPGTTLEELWPSLTLADKSALLFEIGSLMAEVHTVPAGPLATLEPEWNGFIARQRTRFPDRLLRQNLPVWFQEQMEAFVQQNFELLPMQPEPVLLTGEYTPFNLLAEQHNGRWRLSGMIDFGDAMTGFREYDLLGPAVFSGEGNPALLCSFFSGYGFPGGRIDAAQRRRLMLLLILHRYSNLHIQVRIPGWENRVQSIEELEQLIWPVSL